MIGEDKRAKIDLLCIKETGLPYFRSFGADRQSDDAVQLTAEIIKKLQSEYKECEIANVDTDDQYIIEEYTPSSLTSEDIGQWIVTIDYHN
jgi:hypothetical protein